MNIRVLLTSAVVFFGTMSAALASTIEVLLIGSHLTTYTQSGTINVTQTNGSGLNNLDLSTFDVVYADEHADFGARGGDIASGVSTGSLGFVGALTTFFNSSAMSDLNSIVGATVTFSSSPTGSYVLTTEGASSSVLTGVNLSGLRNGSQRLATTNPASTVLMTDSNSDSVILQGKNGSGNWVLMGLEPMESSANADEIRLVRNAIQAVAPSHVSIIPLPAGAWLLIGGLGCLTFIGRRQKLG